MKMADLSFSGNVPGGEEEAFKWYRMAADAGLTAAKVSLGTMYYEGRGVQKNMEKAYEMYSSASEDGDPDASFLKARMEISGAGTDCDPDKGVRSMSKAAEQGSEEAKQVLEQLRRAQNTQFVRIDGDGE